jgi:hypothetical protein
MAKEAAQRRNSVLGDPRAAMAALPHRCPQSRVPTGVHHRIMRTFARISFLTICTSESWSKISQTTLSALRAAAQPQPSTGAGLASCAKEADPSERKDCDNLRTCLVSVSLSVAVSVPASVSVSNLRTHHASKSATRPFTLLQVGSSPMRLGMGTSALCVSLSLSTPRIARWPGPRAACTSGLSELLPHTVPHRSAALGSAMIPAAAERSLRGGYRRGCLRRGRTRHRPSWATACIPR